MARGQAKLLWDYLESLAQGKDGWRSLTVSMRSLGPRFGYTEGSGSAQVRAWVKAGKLEVRKHGTGGPTSKIQAVRIVRGPRQTVERQVEESMADVLLRHIQDHVTERGFLSQSVDKARRSVGLTRHDFNKLMFDLKDRGLVSFAVKGSGSNMTLYNVRIRPAGTAAPLRRVASTTEANEEAAGPAIQPRSQEAPRTNGSVQEDQSSTALVQRAADRAVQRYAEPMVRRYPNLSKLMVRAKRLDALSEAAQVLERAGMIEEAVALLERETLSPLEQEFVAFLRERHTAESALLAEHGPELGAETADVRPPEGVNSSDDPAGPGGGG